MKITVEIPDEELFETARQICAEKIGITEVALSRYVCGNRVPKATTAIKIADVLGTSVESIWGGMTGDADG